MNQAAILPDVVSVGPTTCTLGSRVIELLLFEGTRQILCSQHAVICLHCFGPHCSMRSMHLSNSASFSIEACMGYEFEKKTRFSVTSTAWPLAQACKH